MSLSFSRKHAGLALMALGALGAGCATGQNSRFTSSVVDYLYGDKEQVVTQSIPRLSLPLRVGIAFVPGDNDGRRQHVITENQKLRLSRRIASQFEEVPYVESIEEIPTAYLQPRGGFTNLDQIRSMYDIDVIALISYDQVQHTDEDWTSVTYWTIVGAYVVSGEINDTSTMVDAAVFDIASRKFLFRAPGLSHVTGKGTPVNLSEQLRLDSMEGLELATDELIGNLQAELGRFQQRVEESPEEYEVHREAGYTGGGGVGGDLATALIAFGALASLCNRRPSRI
ncbi:MAG: rhombotarget lipoprotein [Planctomycetes bacterium]|nr:rhombotarget lipoprotein [Planctomycetota bacterium]